MSPQNLYQNDGAWTYYSPFFQEPQLVIFVLLFVFIVFGNMCVIVAIGLLETGRQTRVNM